MSKLTIRNLETLVASMKEQNADKEHFSFTYASKKFDVIIAISDIGFEYLIAIHDINFGITLYANDRYVLEISDNDYLKIMSALQLKYSKDHISSHDILLLLSNHTPTIYSGYKYEYTDLIPYIKCKIIPDADKIYFCGWNDHIKDNKTARNFEKTELLLGHKVADFCRRNNISSMWSSVPSDKISYTQPWKKP